MVSVGVDHSGPPLLVSGDWMSTLIVPQGATCEFVWRLDVPPGVDLTGAECTLYASRNYRIPNTIVATLPISMDTKLATWNPTSISNGWNYSAWNNPITVRDEHGENVTGPWCRHQVYLKLANGKPYKIDDGRIVLVLALNN